MYEVSCIIINFNSGKYIFKCLNHIFNQKNVVCETIVIDNASTDGSLSKLQEYSTKNDFKLIKLKKNIGSSAANNIGIRKAKNRYVLILNADVFLDELAVFKQCEVLSSNIAVCTTGLLLSSRNNSIIDSTGIEYYHEGLGVDRSFGDINKNNLRDGFVFGACCAFAIYDKNFLAKIAIKNQYYDELYFAFFEDLELSIRINLSGGKTYFVKESHGYHVRGGSTSTQSNFVSYLLFRNFLIINLIYLNKKNLIQILFFLLYTFLYSIKNIKHILPSVVFIINNKKDISFRRKIINKNHKLISNMSYLSKKINVFFHK